MQEGSTLTDNTAHKKSFKYTSTRSHMFDEYEYVEDPGIKKHVPPKDRNYYLRK